MTTRRVVSPREVPEAAHEKVSIKWASSRQNLSAGFPT